MPPRKAVDQDPLFESGDAIQDALEPAKLTIPRSIWANTTIRKLAQVLGRLLEIVEAAPGLDRQRYPTWDAALVRLSAILEESEGRPVGTEVVTKTLGLGERFGLLERVKDADRCPTWIWSHHAGIAVTTDPDPGAMFAALLLQVPFKGSAHRQYAGLLRFIRECHDAGIEVVRVDHVAYYMATQAKECPWRRETNALKKFLAGDANRAITDDMWWARIEGGEAVGSAIASGAKRLANAGCTTSADVRRELDTLGKTLLPAARNGGIDDLQRAVVEHVLAGDADAIAQAVTTLLLERKIDTQLDYVQTALRYLAEVGLLEERVRVGSGKEAGRFAITAFGTEALDTLPAQAADHAGAIRALQNTSESPYRQHRQERARRFCEMFERDRTETGRAGLAGALDWDIYRGQGRADEFEYAVVRSIIACVDQPDGTDKAEGINTKLNFDLQPLNHAPGGAPDGRVVLANGRTVIVEVTGETGGGQIKQELEPIIRHLRSIETPLDAPAPAGIFVAPEIDLDMAVFLLAVAHGSKTYGRAPACFVPLTQAQLGRLVVDGRAVNDLLEHLLVLVDAAAALPSLDGAADLLAQIDATIEAYLA